MKSDTKMGCSAKVAWNNRQLRKYNVTMGFTTNRYIGGFCKCFLQPIRGLIDVKGELYFMNTYDILKEILNQRCGMMLLWYLIWSYPMAKSSRTPKSAQKPLLSGLCAEAGLPELNGSIVGPLGNYERYPLVN